MNEGWRRAGFFVRMGALLVDGVIVFAAASLVFFLWYGGWLLASGKPLSFHELFRMSEISSEWAQWFEATIELVIYFGYFTVFHHRWGATFGKRLFRIEVRDERTGAFPSWGRSLGRSLSYLLSLLPFGCGFLMVLFHPRKRALHDLVVSSRVVYSTQGS